MTKDINEGFMMSSNTSYPAYFYWHLFFPSMAIMQLVFSVVFFLVYSIFPKTQKFFRFLSVKNILIGLLLFFAATFIYVFGPSISAGGEIPVRVSPEMSVPVRLPPGVTTPKPSELSPVKLNQ